jgi:hypothetical protein
MITNKLLKFGFPIQRVTITPERTGNKICFGEWTPYDLPMVRIIEHAKLTAAPGRPATVAAAGISRALPYLRGALFCQRLQRIEAARGR